MRKNIVAGNWKMNKNLQEGIVLANELKELLNGATPNCEVVIGTPFIHLAAVAELVKGSAIKVAAQNCGDKESGAYTGEVSAAMVKSTGAEFVILGHSERREYYGETSATLNAKLALAFANGLTPIYCCGEPLAIREANAQNDFVKRQLDETIFALSADDFKKLAIAYEPIWAIGTGVTASTEQAQEMLAYIRSLIADKFGKEIAENTSILYGGSCNAKNAPELFAQPDIDGGLIGGASLKSADFKAIIDAF
ncbi:MAG: triose-phosphate isomerase [Prevotellaceae bacterium]|jgi:triosephosphate isomerase|nr:triose-phosphate isomerase [Prevotellaceae bacterium]